MLRSFQQAIFSRYATTCRFMRVSKYLAGNRSKAYWSVVLRFPPTFTFVKGGNICTLPVIGYSSLSETKKEVCIRYLEISFSSLISRNLETLLSKIFHEGIHAMGSHQQAVLL